MIALLLWLVLLVICWPLALLAALAWLILLPVRLLLALIGAVFGLVRGVVMLPVNAVRGEGREGSRAA